MGYADESNLNIDSQERILLYDMWKILRGEENNEVKPNNLRVILQVITRL
jgi:hypothetical protein